RGHVLVGDARHWRLPDVVRLAADPPVPVGSGRQSRRGRGARAGHRRAPGRGTGGVAVTHTGYLVAGYGATFAVLAAYAAWIVAKRRAMARELPSEERDPRWS